MKITVILQSEVDSNSPEGTACIQAGLQPDAHTHTHTKAQLLQELESSDLVQSSQLYVKENDTFHITMSTC